ncbi:MAG TPA: hypothetical protein VK158_03110 [Acidobacteriota bacterium]|nr:hypothetical protein [Acidobacteriota bacterium]
MKEVHIITGSEKERYLDSLDASLSVLCHNLKNEQLFRKESVEAVARASSWDWSRLPSFNHTSDILVTQLQRVRNMYDLMRSITTDPTPAKNRSHLRELGISTESGLPWYSSITDIIIHKERRDEFLNSLPQYDALALKLQDLLSSDEVDMTEVAQHADKIYQTALQRNYFEYLGDQLLIGPADMQKKDSIIVKKEIDLGVETLWSVSSIQYSRARGMFQIYVMDLWEDVPAEGDEPFVKKEGEGVDTLSDKFAREFDFSENNDAWYMLQKIDEEYPTIHPVHMTRLLVGPFDNQYFTSPQGFKPFPVSLALIDKDKEFDLLRCSRDYAYAPNAEVRQGRTFQKIHRMKWNDLFSVTKAKYAGTVAEHLLGAQSYLFEK